MKGKKHNNVMGLGVKGEDMQNLQIICRGCIMHNRLHLWNMLEASIAAEPDNSYLIFEEEPNNPYDANAIMVVCRGEFFGTLGYVAKEMTGQVKQMLDKCKFYRIDFNTAEIGNKEINLNILWY